MMALYKEEKVNPLAGCWPIFLQIPVFFALYKVIFITIEMRHAPFYGWIHDLSAPDPTSDLQPVRPDPLDAAAYPDAGRLADHHGHHHVRADAHEPDASGSDPGVTTGFSYLLLLTSCFNLIFAQIFELCYNWHLSARTGI